MKLQQQNRIRSLNLSNPDVSVFVKLDPIQQQLQLLKIFLVGELLPQQRLHLALACIVKFVPVA